MHRFKNILAYVTLALDKSPAFARGIFSARQHNTQLTVITVIEQQPAQAHAMLRSIPLMDALEGTVHATRLETQSAFALSSRCCSVSFIEKLNAFLDQVAGMYVHFLQEMLDTKPVDPCM